MTDLSLREQIASTICGDRAVDNWNATDADYELANAILELLKGAVPVWQPIETAPKDGTHVILGTTGSATPGRILLDMFYESGEWGNYDDVLEDMLFAGERLTHWMPLPLAPALAALGVK